MKKAILIPLGILCLFIITNPSVSAFKTYRGRESYQGLYRPVNLFVLSEYKDRGNEFIGVFGNFIPVKHYVPVEMVIGADSVKSAVLNENGRTDSSIHVVGTTKDGLPIFKAKLSISEFAQMIKTKYPSYNQIDDEELVKKILAKYPVYKDDVDLSYSDMIDTSIHKDPYTEFGGHTVIDIKKRYDEYSIPMKKKN